MDLFDLFAKISLDTSEYEAGLEKASKKLSGFASGLEKGFSGTKSVLSTAAEGFKAVEGVGQVTGNVLVKGAKSFATISTAIAGFGGSAVKAGMDFDSGMSQVAAISGATENKLGLLRKKALEMGATTQFSAAEAAEAMTYMSMAGWDAEDMLTSIGGIMNLAAASGEDLASVSDIVTDAMTAFGLAADGSVDGVSNAAHFSDILAAASSSANTNVGLMGETFKYVAPVMGALGYSAEDTAIAVGLMANSGIKGTQAGTALRTAITNLASPTKNMVGVMEQYGISLTDADGNMLSLLGVIDQLREKMGGLDEATQASAASTLFGKEAMSGMLAIINAAPDDYEKLTAAIYDCDGASEKMAKTMNDNLAGDIKLFKSALESLQITISDALTPTLREFTQFGARAIEQLTMGFQNGGIDGFFSALTGVVTQAVEFLADKAPEFVKVSGKFIESLATGILDAREKIITSFNQSINIIIDGLDSWLNENGEALLDFGMRMVNSIFNAFTSAGEVISKHIGDFVPLIANAFLQYHESLFTVGMDILGAIGQGLSENKDTITELASSTIANIVTAFTENAPMIIDGAIALLEALVTAISENLPMIAQAAVEIVSHLASSIGEALPNLIPAAVEAVITFVETLTSPTNLSLLIDGALELITGLVDGLLQALPKLVAAAPVIITNLVTGLIAALPKIFEAAVEIILALAKGLIQAIPELLKAVPQIIMALIEAIIAFVVNFVEAGAKLIMALGEGIAGAWNSIVEFFSSSFQDLIAFLDRTWEFIKNGAKAAWDAISQVFKAAWDAVVKIWESAGEFFSGVWKGIQDAFSAAVDWFRDIFSRAWEAIKSVWDAVAGFFSDLAEGIREVFSNVMEAVAGFFRDAWEAVKAVWDAAVGFFQGIWDAITGLFSAAAEVIGGFFSAAWDVVSGIWGAAGEFFSGIWETITGVFSGAAEWFGNIFSQAWEAITSVWDGVGEFFSGIWDTITGFFSNAWDVFSNIGENIVKGLWNGITGLAGWLWDKISGWVQSIWNGVTSFFGINSPARKFIWMSQMNIKGAVVGIDRYGGEATRAMKSLGEDMADAFNPRFDFPDFPNNFGGGPGGIGYPGPGGPIAGSPSPTTVIINSPTAVDPIQAAREWNKTAQRLAVAYI